MTEHLNDADPQLEVTWKHGDKTQIYVLEDDDTLILREAPDHPSIRGRKAAYGPCILTIEYRGGGHDITEWPLRDEDVEEGMGDGFWQFMGRLITHPEVEGDVTFHKGMSDEE